MPPILKHPARPSTFSVNISWRFLGTVPPILKHPARPSTFSVNISWRFLGTAPVSGPRLRGNERPGDAGGLASDVATARTAGGLMGQGCGSVGSSPSIRVHIKGGFKSGVANGSGEHKGGRNQDSGFGGKESLHSGERIFEDPERCQI